MNNKYSRDKYYDWLMLDSGQEIAICRLAHSQEPSKDTFQQSINELREINRERFSRLIQQSRSEAKD